MKHLPYENWILDESYLCDTDSEMLIQHLASCRQCSRIKSGWEASKALLSKPKFILPAPGFTTRWQNSLIRKCSSEKVRRFRITVFALSLLIFSASLIYMVANGSFMLLLANFFNSLIQAAIAITNGLASIGVWVNKMPFYIPLAVGFVFFGLINAFLMSAVFTIWNLKRVKAEVHENTWY
jgi:hypothetical protein